MDFALVYRQSTFCPCPGGDSPSAKRMFDALHAGCIPVILSHDFVWPGTAEFDTVRGPDQQDNGMSTPLLDPETFSIRLEAGDYNESNFDPVSCEPIPERASTATPLQAYLESIPKDEIARLRQGARRASDQYSYYARSPDLPRNPLQRGELPTGGAAHALVAALADRAEGRLWPACEEELERRRRERAEEEPVTHFQC